jgi:hypothetical protein
MEQNFHLAVTAILESWTALEIAIDQQLAGVQSNLKLQDLHSSILSYFSGKTTGDDWDELSGNFEIYFDETFNLGLEDGSADLVAKVCAFNFLIVLLASLQGIPRTLHWRHD